MLAFCMHNDYQLRGIAAPFLFLFTSTFGGGILSSEDTMKTLIVVLLVVLVITGIFIGIKNTNNSMIGTASASISAHNAAIEQVAKETAN